VARGANTTIQQVGTVVPAVVREGMQMRLFQEDRALPIKVMMVVITRVVAGRMGVAAEPERQELQEQALKLAMVGTEWHMIFQEP